MKFSIPKSRENIISISRKIGYVPISASETKEFNMVRSIGRGDYPRFHIYITEDAENFIFNLHLDQKKPSYAGNHAHSGEYDGDLVSEEANRIKLAFS